MISYPELPTFRTAGFTKWFAESFLAYRGLSKKELDVKQSSGKGLGKSDGIRREEVLSRPRTRIPAAVRPRGRELESK